MGNCIKKKRNPENISSISMPIFIYFDQKHRNFHRISQSSNKILALNPILPGSLYHSNYLISSLYLIQANNNQNPSIPCNYHLDLNTMTLTSIKSLPNPIKSLSTVYNSKQFLIISSNPFNIFTYNNVQDTWIELKPKNKIIENLTQYTPIIYKNQLIILCGTLLNSEFSDKVFSVNLKKKACLEEIRNFKAPAKLLNAKGYCAKNQVFVAGGQDEFGRISSKLFFAEEFREWESVDLGNLVDCQECFFIECQEVVCIVCFPVVFVVKNKILIQFLAPDYYCKNEVLSTVDYLVTKQYSKDFEDKVSVMNKDASDISASFILHANVITPISMSLHKTITSSDSDFDSQRLYSDEEPIEAKDLKNPEIVSKASKSENSKLKIKNHGSKGKDRPDPNLSHPETCNKD